MEGNADMYTTFFYKLIGIFTKTGKKWDQLAPSEKIAIDFAHKYVNPEPGKNDGNISSLEGRGQAPLRKYKLKMS